MANGELGRRANGGNFTWRARGSQRTTRSQMRIVDRGCRDLVQRGGEVGLELIGGRKWERGEPGAQDDMGFLVGQLAAALRGPVGDEKTPPIFRKWLKYQVGP